MSSRRPFGYCGANIVRFQSGSRLTASTSGAASAEEEARTETHGGMKELRAAGKERCHMRFEAGMPPRRAGHQPVNGYRGFTSRYPCISWCSAEQKFVQ